MSRTPSHPVTDEADAHPDPKVDPDNGPELETALVEDVEVDLDEDLLKRARSF
jgi:hypothetical protein